MKVYKLFLNFFIKSGLFFGKTSSFTASVISVLRVVIFSRKLRFGASSFILFVGPLIHFSYLFSLFKFKKLSNILFLKSWVSGSLSNNVGLFAQRRPLCVFIFGPLSEYRSLLNECHVFNIPVVVFDNAGAVCFLNKGVYSIFLDGSKLKTQFFCFYLVYLNIKV